MPLRGRGWQAFAVHESHDRCGAVSHERVEQSGEIISYTCQSALDNLHGALRKSDLMFPRTPWFVSGSCRSRRMKRAVLVVRNVSAKSRGTPVGSIIFLTKAYPFSNKTR